MEWVKKALGNGRKLEIKEDKGIKAKLDSIDMKLKECGNGGRWYIMKL